MKLAIKFHRPPALIKNPDYLLHTTILFNSSSHLVMDGHMSRVFSVQFTPGQDHEFLSGGWDDTVQVSNASLMPACRYRADKKSPVRLFRTSRFSSGATNFGIQVFFRALTVVFWRAQNIRNKCECSQMSLYSCMLYLYIVIVIVKLLGKH